MTKDDLRELLLLAINRNTSSLDASPIDEVVGDKTVIGIEHLDSGALFFLEIIEA